MAVYKKPNLIICGVQKGGTTWLHHKLKLHPDIFGSKVKELDFFNQNEEDIQEGFADYLKKFDQESSYSIRMESTPHYFWRKEKNSIFSAGQDTFFDTAENIYKYLDRDAQMIVMLRDPVSRAISAYHHNYAMGRNNACKTIFDCDPNWGLIELGFYRRHIEHWDALFGDRLHYYFFDDITNNPLALIRRILTDINLKLSQEVEASVLTNSKVNTREEILERNDDVSQKEFPKLTRQEVGALLAIYRPDIRYVEKRLGVDLPHWRNIYDLIRLNEKHIK